MHISLQLVLVWVSASKGLVHHVEPVTSMENLDYFVWRTDRHPDSPIPKCPHFLRRTLSIRLASPAIEEIQFVRWVRKLASPPQASCQICAAKQTEGFGSNIPEYVKP
jgi:hypothetical protein